VFGLTAAKINFG